MRKICAWCGKEIAPETGALTGGEISHGICSVCALEFTRQGRRTIKQIVGLIAEPVLVIGDDARVIAANRRAASELGKRTSQMEGELGGDAIECIHASEEGGCGKTVHCAACTLRNTVTDTLKSGAGHQNVLARQQISTPDGTREVEMTISTEKVNELVLMKIERIKMPDQ